MKHIQWFPGHMTKAMRMMEEMVSLCDAVLCVLDSRAPAATFNPNLKGIFASRPVLYVLNKADLGDPVREEGFCRLIEEKGSLAVRCSATQQNAKRDLLAKIARLTADTRAKHAAKGMTKPVRLMVAGVPNTGKSTVINLLNGSKKAVTGDKAGVTRSKQWIRCDGFELLDTPGTMPPAFENQYLARHLAYIGSINDDILEMDEIALALLEELYALVPETLREKYAVESDRPLEMLEAVCRRRGFVLRGGDFDYERGERAVLDDFRKGRLGRITLERAEDFAGTEY